MAFRSFRLQITAGLFWTLWFAGTASAKDVRPRLLFIGLDAVPHSTMATVMDPARGDEALFQGLPGPVPLISTFPSTTSLAFAGILEPLGLGRSPGYEARFFDRARGKVRGGGLFSYGKIKFPWREFWDWKLQGLVAKMTSGARPVKVVRKNIRRSLEAFRQSEKDVFFIYYTTTDLVSHLKSPPGLEPVLADLDAGLRALREDPEVGPFHVVIFSDHGMDGGVPLVNVRKDLQRALKGAGFRRGKRLKRPDRVVFAPFGLVSSFVAFTQSGHEAEVAEILAAVDGVDVCAATDGESAWRVFGGASDEGQVGEARIVRRDGESGSGGSVRYAYERRHGDPLELGPVVETLGGEVQSDADWLEATRERNKPDPIYRVVRGFDVVENSASLICGLAPGHMFGSAMTSIASRLSIGKLRWTHGAIDRRASLGFVTSDVPSWTPPTAPVRFDHALLPFVHGYEAAIQETMTMWSAK